MMQSVFELTRGNLPIIISMPHNGSAFPEELKSQLIPKALHSRDTDWFLDRLYSFAKESGCSLLNPFYSRYVVDLNRAADGSELYPGADNTELCPTTGFDHLQLYPTGKNPTANEIKRRIEQYWLPYHQALQHEITRLRSLFPQVIVFEAHSIASHVERFFPGKLTDFNFGNNNGKSSSDELIRKLQDNLKLEPYSSVVNGRFKGGYITRHYGNPTAGIHTIQLELSQDTYMDEATLSWDENKAARVIPKLQLIIGLLERAGSKS